MNNNVTYVLIFLFAVFISSCSQILLKKSADIEHKNKIREYVNIRVIVAYSLFFAATLLNVIAFKVVPLSFGPVIESSSYIFIAVLSYIFLKEKLTIKKISGISIIIMGVLIYTIL